MTILLDHNYTLVANSQDRRRPFTEQIEIERYRPWLLDLIRPHRVILVTARPKQHRAQTLASIQEKTGWQPDEAYFNGEMGGPARPHLHKRAVLRHLLANGYDVAGLIAIESNPATRKMYHEHGVPCLTIPENRDGSPN